MSDETISIIERGKTADIRVRLMNWHGRDYCDIRTFVSADATGEREPTRKGIAIPIKLLDDVIEALHEAQQQAKASGLLKAEAA